MDVVADVRQACRSLSRRPAFAAVVVLTLGVAVGACTAIFSVVHALLLRPLPFVDPDLLVRVSISKGGEEGPLSTPELDDLGRLDVVDAVAGYTDQGLYNASGFGAPEELQATITTHNLFRTLGVPLLVGDAWPASYDRSRQFALIISHGLWMRRFGGRPDVVGQTLTLDGSPGYVVHGVLPPGVNFPSRSDLFRSSGIAADPNSYERRDLRSRMALVRLKPGVSIDRARVGIASLAARLSREFPTTNAGVAFEVTPLRDLYVGEVRPHVLLLLAGVGLVVLVACSNVAGLLLSRSLARSREIAVRQALGAPRSRLIPQVLTESLLLSLTGGVVGLLFAWIGARLLARLVAMPLPPWMHVQIDGTVSLFLCLLAVATGLAAGGAAAWRSGTDVRLALSEGGRGSSSGASQSRLRSVLVAAEVALAVVLLVGASLLTQSVWQLQRADAGFRTEDLLSFRVELGWRAYDTHAKTMAFHTSTIERLRSLSGVDAVAFDSNLALSGTPRDPEPIIVEGHSLGDRERTPFVHWHTVSAGFVQALHVPVVAGRGFTELDLATTERVAIVSERLAERFWPGDAAIGKRVKGSDRPDSPWLTVVGVAGNVRHQRLGDEPSLDVYLPFRQSAAGGGWYVMRTSLPPERLVRAATAVVGTVDPNQSFFDVRTMSERIEASLWQRRAAGSLFMAFAVIALLLAAVGLYSVLSFTVAQQRREIGLRIALGAQRADIYRHVLSHGLRLTGIGLAIGLVLGAGLS